LPALSVERARGVAMKQDRRLWFEFVILLAFFLLGLAVSTAGVWRTVRAMF
jgi:hypothetical protein